MRRHPADKMLNRFKTGYFVLWTMLMTGFAAGLGVPGWVFTSERFDQTRTLAEHDKKCLILVFPESKFIGAEELTVKCFREFKSLAVVMFIDGMNDPHFARPPIFPYAWDTLRPTCC